MAQSESVRPEWAALELVHELADADILQVSPEKDWDVVAVTRFRLGNIDVSVPALGVPMFGVNYGADMQLERTLHGRKVSGVGAPGHLSLLPPDADTRWVFDKAGGDIVLVFLSRALFDRALEESTGRDPRSVEIVPQFVIRDLVLERVAHQLLKAVSEPGAGSRLLTETIAQALAAHLIAAHTNLERGGRPHPIAPSKLKRAEDFIQANIESDMSLQDIADAAGMSLFHFAKAFKQATGRTPHQYVIEQRVRQARALLHDTSLSIGQVASAVGFSHSHFTAVFARHMGMTPRKFRDVLYP
ncbi:MAG: helix-turn-helix transcriptional regulator [Hyphomicrobiaceae bacterium]|nr:MAG: helix-turn-helix transcriptional regulator [Hyphomicrobiaceae bacterium]